MSKLLKRCPNCCTTSEVKLKPHLIIAGSITFFVGVVDLGINSLVFSYLTNYFYGAWWSAMIVSATGLMGTFSIRRGVVVVACVTSVFAILMAFIGVVVDGVGLSQMMSMTTCASTSSYYDTENYVYYGQSKYEDDAFVCIQTYYTADTDCYCVDSGGNCFFLNGQKNCGVILGDYRTDLKVSVGMDVMCLLSILSLSIVTCFSLCCPYGFKKKKTSNFKVELKANERESITSNPLQNDARPVLSRVKTFAFGSGKDATPDPNASNMNIAEELKTPTKQVQPQQDTFSNPMVAAKRANNADMPAPLYSSASKTEAAFSSSVADFSFDSPKPAAAAAAPTAARPTPPPPPPAAAGGGAAAPAPPTTPKAGGGAPPPPPPPPLARTPTATHNIGAGMSSNPLAATKRRQLTKQASGIDKDAVAASEELDREDKS